MKTILILVLFVVLLIGMFLSCPSPDSFDKYYHNNIAATESKGFDFHFPFTHDMGLSHYQYVNRYLVALEEKDGKVVYIGVFNHWFADGPSTTSK